MPVDTLQSAVILVVSNSEETAKRIESHIRNAGHSVRGVWVTDLEDLEDVLRRNPPDLVLAEEGHAGAGPGDVLALCARIAPDLPVVQLSPAVTLPAATAAMAAGARDVVSHADEAALRHLELVCLREILHQQQQRELRSTRARLADFEARHRNLMASSTDAVVHVQEGILTHVNAAFATLIGYPAPEELEGLPLMDLVAPEGQAQTKQNLKLLLQGKLATDKPLDLVLRRKEGASLPVKARLTVSGSAEDHVVELVIRADAVSAPAAAQGTPAGPAPAARPPAPTGAPARIALFDTLTAISNAKPQGIALGLLMIAIDGYEAIEQRLGFRDVEQLVLQLTELLKQRLSRKDMSFRFSMSELALVVIRAKPAEIQALAETLRKDVAAQIFTTASHEAHLSITVVGYPLSGKETPKNVVAETVLELRKLSSQGGNKVATIGAAAQAAMAEREEALWVQRIQKALQENRLKLAYQSIASLEGESRQHFDVLLRMLDETGKELQAKEFVPIAEKHGLIKAIDRWVIARALKVLAKREGAADVSSLFVRISEDTLRDADGFLAWLRDLFKTRPLKKDELVFQIQEIIMQNHIAKAKTLAIGLRQLGAEVCLDHFGVGDNSLKMVEHIPAGFLRFHFSFTKNFNDAKLQKKMAELMGVAKEKGIKTIVSHVEDANAMARLWQMGVNYIQGHHIQEPEVVLLSTELPR